MNTQTVLLIAVEGGNQFLAYGASNGHWDRYEVPDGVSSSAYVDRDAAAFRLEGVSIAELVAVDNTGRFHKHRLKEPVRGPVMPTVVGGVVQYVAGGKIHAFSAKTGTWDSLDAPLEDARIHHYGTILVVLFENQAAAFSLDSGKWTSEEFVEASAQDARPPRLLNAEAFLLVAVEGGSQFLAYGASDGHWERYEVQDGVAAWPVTAGDETAAFGLKGDAIAELVAVDSAGRFHKHRLPEPVSGNVTPIVSCRLVHYVAGGKVHAFSAKTGTWDSLDAPNLEDARLVHNPPTIVVLFENQAAAFSVDSGKWAIEKFARQ